MTGGTIHAWFCCNFAWRRCGAFRSWAGAGASADTCPCGAGPRSDAVRHSIRAGDHRRSCRESRCRRGGGGKKSPRNWKLAIAVVDPNGDLVYFYKMDQTQVASIGIAQGKARTAARFRRPSGAFFTAMQNPAGAFLATLDPTLVASTGGFPLVEGGKLIGAIGCSGATGDQDGVACKAGADTVK
jgi:glc operon protein GlcG